MKRIVANVSQPRRMLDVLCKKPRSRKPGILLVLFQGHQLIVIGGNMRFAVVGDGAVETWISPLNAGVYIQLTLKGDLSPSDTLTC